MYDLTDSDTTTTDLDGFDADGLDGTDGLTERAPFVPNYTPCAGTRILRARLYADAGGVATVTFRGTLDEQALWTERGGSGRLSVYAEVTRTDDTDTTLRIALVPTGKRVPEDAKRLGSGRGVHAYLLDATVGPRPTPAEADDTDAQPTTVPATAPDAHLDDLGD